VNDSLQLRSYQECSRCVMDTTDLQIKFDSAGHCCHCTEYIEKRAKHNYHGKESDAALDAILERILKTGKGKKYDCVIGVSGGADSSYLAYIMRERGLRLLAVHLDNGWNSEKAVINIKNVTRGLGIDYESYVLDWEEFKHVQLAFLKASVPEAETPTDVAIPAALHSVAAKHGIKYILSGGNLATEGILPKSWHYDVRDLKYFNHIYSTFGTRPLKTFPTFGYKKEIFYKVVMGMRMVYPLNLVPYVKDDAIKLLREKFNWRPYGGKHHESTYTKFIQSYYLYEKFKIDYRRATLSTQICVGEIERCRAVEQLKSLPYDPQEIDEAKNYITKKLGIDRDELERIMRLPPKWYRDYPNDERRLSFIYDTYRKLYKLEKLDRF
jgi:N-acetyl sugar amidotransferase